MVVSLKKKPIKPSGDLWVVNVLIFSYCHSPQLFNYACHLSWKALWEEALWGNSPSAHVLVLVSVRIHHQLAEESKGKGRSLRFGSQRGTRRCFAFLGATSHGLVYGGVSLLQPVCWHHPRPSLVTGESSQSEQSFTCCNTGGKSCVCEKIGDDHEAEAFLNAFFFILWLCIS